MNIQLFSKSQQTPKVQEESSRTSMYESVISQNPLLKQVFDFKTILFSSSKSKLSPEECEQIYNGKKKVNLITNVKYENGQLQLRRTKSEAQEMLMKLKMMNAQARMRAGQRDLMEGEYNYENEEDDEYEDIYDDVDDEMGNMYGDDEYEYDEGYEGDENLMDYNEDYYYKQMLRDMEEDIEKEIYDKLDQDMHSKHNKQSQKNYLSRYEIDQFKATEKQENSKKTDSTSNQNKKKNTAQNEEEQEWQTDSDEWEDDGDDEHEEDSDDNKSRSSQNQQNKKSSQKKNGFSSIKVCQEDYQD